VLIKKGVTTSEKLMLASRRHRSGLSTRRTSTLLKLSRSTLFYEHKMEKRDASGLKRMREACRRFPRRGCKFIREMLAREGQVMSKNRSHRLWQKGGFQVKRRIRRRKQGTPRDQMPLHAQRPNQVWAYDFMFDSTTDGKKRKVLTVIDAYTKEVSVRILFFRLRFFHGHLFLLCIGVHQTGSIPRCADLAYTICS
jgi:putative transposase